MLSKSRVERSLRRRLRARKNRRKIALRLSTSGLAPEASPRGDVSGGHGVASRLYHWVQGSPLPKEVRNPRRVPHQIKFFASRLSLPRDSLSAAPSHNPRMDRHARELPAESLPLARVRRNRGLPAYASRFHQTKSPPAATLPGPCSRRCDCIAA